MKSVSSYSAEEFAKRDVDDQQSLTDALAWASYKYYVENDPPMSDYEFDMEFKRLQALERASGRVLPGSPTQRVGSDIQGAFRKARHVIPMQSIENVYTDGELREWLASTREKLLAAFPGETISFTYEPKYDDVKAAFEAGFTHVTHFYNAMPGFHNKMGYKYEGTVESVYLIDDMTIECIADGIHVPPTILRMAYKIKGVERMALITDALAVAAAGPDAKAFDDRVIIEDGVCKLADRSALAGSIATTDRLVRTMVQQAEVPLEDAVRMASETPAHIMGVFGRKGALARGKDADVLILDDKLTVRCVWQMGKIIENTLF